MQIEVLQREVSRLTSENSRLHSDVLRESDARQAQDRASYQRSKHLEGQVAELQLVRQQAAENLAAVEREREGLKAKVQDLLAIGQHVPPGGWTSRQ